MAECGTGEHTLGMAVGEEADVLDGRELNVWVEEQRVDSLVEVCVVERRGEEGGWVTGAGGFSMRFGWVFYEYSILMYSDVF